MSLPITVVTVAFGNSEVIRKWAQQWTATGATCVISDNGNQIPDEVSSDAFVLPFTGNNGFGGGINCAVQKSDTPVILITNPDTLPTSSAESLKTLLDYHTQGSFTGATTVDPAGKEVHSTGVWPDKDWAKSQIFKSAESLWRRDRMDWVQGSLIMVNRDDFLKLGGFSNRFPLYFEDLDICARAVKSGMKVDFCQGSKFIHDEGSGSERATATRLSCFHWGMLEFFRRHDPANSGAVRKMIIAKCFLRMSAYALVDPQVFRGYYRALRSVFSGIVPKLPGALND